MSAIALFDAGALELAATGWMAELALKGVLLLLCASAVTRIWRAATAAAKHWVWCVAFGSLLALPLLRAGLPRWRIPGSQPLVQALAAQPSGPGIGVVRTPLGTDILLEELSMNSGAGLALSWQGSLLILWAAGAVLFLGLLAAAHIRAAWLTRRSCPIRSPRCLTLVDRLCRRLGIGSPPMVVEADAGAMPLTRGIVRPVIVLPRGAAESWDLNRLEAVLVHELAHIRRRDIAAQLLGQSACALHWFNPLAWVALRRMRLESEKACDDVVLHAGVKASSYAEYLLGLARGQRGRRAPALACRPMAEPSQLPIRLRWLLDEGQRHEKASLRALAVMLAVGMASASLIAAASPAAAGDLRPNLQEGTPSSAQAPLAAAEPPHRSLPLGEASARTTASGAMEPLARRSHAAGQSGSPLPLLPGDTIQPVLLNADQVYDAVEENYPVSLRQAGMSGTALLELQIDARGAVGDARVVTASDPAFGEAARSSLLEARFAPARAEGEAIAVRVLWPVAFNALAGSFIETGSARAARLTAIETERIRSMESRLRALALQARATEQAAQAGELRAARQGIDAESARVAQQSGVLAERAAALRETADARRQLTERLRALAAGIAETRRPQELEIEGVERERARAAEQAAVAHLKAAEAGSAEQRRALALMRAARERALAEQMASVDSMRARRRAAERTEFPTDIRALEEALTRHHPTLRREGLPAGRFVWFVVGEAGEVLHTGIADQRVAGRVDAEEIRDLLAEQSIEGDLRSLRYARLDAETGEKISVVWIRLADEPL